jgi:hypothetical protein
MLSHDVSKECLLELKQILACVGDLLKKPAIGDKIEPLGFQKVGLKNGRPRVTWLGHFIVSSKIRKC